MRKNYLLAFVFLCLQLHACAQSAQTIRSRLLHVALVPGISSNGIHGDKFVNTLSFNFISGYSGGNGSLELGVISNFNVGSVQGLQVAGISNILGDRATVKSKSALKNEAPLTMAGVQVSGAINLLEGTMKGVQATGGVNIVRREAIGMQSAGLANQVDGVMTGVQVAGVRNTAGKALDGVQIAGLHNKTGGVMQGFQASAFNQAMSVNGRKSPTASRATGLQLGFFNAATSVMAGYQIGLVNFGGDMRGTQIGLVNINKRTNGTPIGLFSFDSEAFIRLTASELFLANLEIATGTKRMYNTVSFSYNTGAYVSTPGPKWGIGYSLGKTWHSPGYIMQADVQAQHINFTSSFTKGLSLSGKARASLGLPVNAGFTSFYLLLGITMNSYVSDKSENMERDFMPLRIGSAARASDVVFWPGCMIGIQSK